MRTQLLLLAVVALVGAAVAKKGKGADEKVKVAVYYESRCPDSKTFIVQQLAPVWKDLRGSIKVKLVPYGKASQTKVDGKWKFECQHGEAECYGNKIQSCILKDKKIVDTDKVAAVVCLMSQDDPEKSLTKCGDEVKLAKDVVSRIQECSDSEQGSNLLAVNGDKTHAVEPKITFVPTVIFNESFDQGLQNQAITNLKAVICQLAPKKPAVCN